MAVAFAAGMARQSHMEKVPEVLGRRCVLPTSSMGISPFISCPSPPVRSSRKGHFLESHCRELQGFAAVVESPFIAFKLEMAFSNPLGAGFGQIVEADVYRGKIVRWVPGEPSNECSTAHG